MNDIGDRIKYARELRGLSQEELAERSGVSQTSITDVERGRSKMPRGLNKIAKALQVSVEWLMTGDGMAPDPDDPAPVKESSGPPAGYVAVRMTTAKLGAGNTAVNSDDRFTEVAGGMLFRQQSFAMRGLQPSSMHVGFVEGESMWPTLHHKTAVMFDESQTSPVDDEIFAFQYVQTDGETQVKRLFWLPDSRIRIVSDNPDKSRYPDVYVAVDQLRIIGRYAWHAMFNPRLSRR